MDQNTDMMTDEELQAVSGGKKEKLPYIEPGTHVWPRGLKEYHYNPACRKCRPTYLTVGMHNNILGTVRMLCPLCGKDFYAEDTDIDML